MLQEGPSLMTGYYAVPWSLNTSAATMSALNTLTWEMITSGGYEAMADSEFPDATLRAQCGTYWAQQSAAAAASSGLTLDLPDLAGVFALQAVGCAAALVALMAKHSMKRLAASAGRPPRRRVRRRRRSPTGCAHPQ